MWQRIRNHKNHDITHHYIAWISVWCWIMLLFYDFCSLWSVAIMNIMDKLFLFVFIFADILLNLRTFLFSIFRKFRRVSWKLVDLTISQTFWKYFTLPYNHIYVWREMTIFHFYKWWLSAILNFLNSKNFNNC